MIYIIWEFQVDSHYIDAFEQAYGSEGSWAMLFMKSKKYHGTTLIKDNSKPGIYLTMDCWNDFTAFEQFQKQFSKDYYELDHLCEKMTVAEHKIGSFEKI